jgi:hypothetical protein
MASGKLQFGRFTDEQSGGIRKRIMMPNEKKADEISIRFQNPLPGLS